MILDPNKNKKNKIEIMPPIRSPAINPVADAPITSAHNIVADFPMSAELKSDQANRLKLPS